MSANYQISPTFEFKTEWYDLKVKDDIYKTVDNIIKERDNKCTAKFCLNTSRFFIKSLWLQSKDIDKIEKIDILIGYNNIMTYYNNGFEYYDNFVFKDDKVYINFFKDFPIYLLNYDVVHINVIMKREYGQDINCYLICDNIYDKDKSYEKTITSYNHVCTNLDEVTYKFKNKFVPMDDGGFVVYGEYIPEKEFPSYKESIIKTTTCEKVFSIHDELSYLTKIFK